MRKGNSENSASRPEVFIDSNITGMRNTRHVRLIPVEPGDLSHIKPGSKSKGAPYISHDFARLSQSEKSGFLPLHVLDAASLRHLDKLPDRRLIFHSVQAAISWIVTHPGGITDLERTIKQGAVELKKGELTAFPTETVYGLGANALDPAAVEKIFIAKKRPKYDPLIVHISEMEQLNPLVSVIPEKARALTEHFWPGPLTMVFPKSGIVPDICTSGHPTVAVRMPSNPWARKLIHLAELPVAAPSANLFGRTSPTTADHVAEQLEGSYRVLIDAGACRVGVESTVLSVCGETPQLLRAGGITREAIEELIGPVTVSEYTSAANAESPGMLPNHYAPRTPLLMVPDIRDYVADKEIGAILYQEYSDDFTGPTVTVSKRRDPREIALGIYAALRKLDSMELSLIVAEWCPEKGIGTAVNDRLRKASAHPVAHGTAGK